jgi:hypothetical protein
MRASPPARIHAGYVGFFLPDEVQVKNPVT